jgi:hypothetical protein
MLHHRPEKNNLIYGAKEIPKPFYPPRMVPEKGRVQNVGRWFLDSQMVASSGIAVDYVEDAIIPINLSYF